MNTTTPTWTACGHELAYPPMRLALETVVGLAWLIGQASA